MDPRVATLVGEQRLEAAAELAAAIGALADASVLWERACQFERAARCALDADDPPRALLLAARVHATELEDEAIARLAAGDGSRDVADALRNLGRPATAARLLLASGEPGAAASDFEAAGQLRDAAMAHERASAPREAARCLEALLRIEPADHAARLQLGALLLRHRRVEPALRTLQAIPESAPERSAALPLLHEALNGLGLFEASRKVAAEMQERGIAPERTEVVDPEGTSGQVLFGRYLVEQEIARTPTARVLRARDRVSGDIVAVKLFSARAVRDVGRDALRRFEQEARVLGELRHRSIVPLHDYHPEGPALVLPWMNGGSLADLLERGALSPARSAEIVTTVLDALEEAHRRGFLHRDVKPANVLFDEAGAPYLADFGTAHVSDAAATVTAGVIGTLAYMAPEQRAGAPATLASDVYGAGALFWHALTGAPPGIASEFLSDEITDEQAGIARQLVAPESNRPPDAATARALVGSSTWSRNVPPPRSPQQVVGTRSSPPVASARLEPLESTLHRDRLLDRRVHVLPADPAVLERAAAFARANHPHLAAILCCRHETRTLWIEAISGPRPVLDSSDIEALRAALLALHRTGGYHGHVDLDHIVRRNTHIMLRFPLAPQPGTAEQDLAALERLAV